jgi:hypothetical protein
MCAARQTDHCLPQVTLLTLKTTRRDEAAAASSVRGQMRIRRLPAEQESRDRVAGFMSRGALNVTVRHINAEPLGRVRKPPRPCNRGGLARSRPLKSCPAASRVSVNETEKRGYSWVTQLGTASTPDRDARNDLVRNTIDEDRARPDRSDSAHGVTRDS